jgi:hypothetical protein
MGIERLLVNKQSFLKNTRLKWLIKKTNQPTNCFLLPSTYAADAAEAGTLPLH